MTEGERDWDNPKEIGGGIGNEKADAAWSDGYRGWEDAQKKKGIRTYGSNRRCESTTSG